MKNLRIIKDQFYGAHGNPYFSFSVYRDHEPKELKYPITEGLRERGVFVIQAASMEIAEKFIKDNEI